MAQSAIGTIGQQDPANWSDPSAFAAMLSSQKSAISAALPPEIAKALNATGLLAGLGSFATAATQTASSTVSSAASAASAATSAAASRAQAAVPSSSGFPMWAIILLVVIVLAAIWWFVTQNHQPEPAKTGMAPAFIEIVSASLPGSSA